MSVTALSIDAMIPALGLMTTDLHVQNANDIQMVITAIFFGMSLLGYSIFKGLKTFSDKDRVVTVKGLAEMDMMSRMK